MWKKNVCQRLKIKQSGKIDLFVGLLSVFMVALVMFVCLKISYFMIAGAYVEDALAASNLASVLIDIEEYGRSHTLQIHDPQKSYEIYREALSINLQLDEAGVSGQKALLEGKIKVLNYMVYNVEGNKVEEFAVSEGGTMLLTATGEIGQLYTPDGVLVETTTVYSRIAFGVKGFGNQYIYAEKEKSADVKRNKEE